MEQIKIGKAQKIFHVGDIIQEKNQSWDKANKKFIQI